MRPRTFAVALTLAGAGLAHAAAVSAEPLSRAQVVARALEVNPDIQKSLEDLALFDGRRREALADALPSLTLLGSFTRFRDPSLLNSSSFDSFPPELRESLTPVPANLYEGGLELRQTLFSFKLGRAIKAARVASKASREEWLRARQAVALEAVRAYDNYLLSVEMVRVAEKAVRQKEIHVDMARNRRQAGVATDLDVLRSQVDLENTRTQLLRMRGQLDLARGTLNAVMVRPIDAPVEPTDRLEFAPLDVSLDQAVQEAWANRPEARAAGLNEQIYEELIGVAQAEGRPTLEFVGYYGSSVRERSNFLDGDFARWSAQVELKVPLFDGWRSAGKVAQARAERRKRTQDRIALENRIRLEAKDAADSLRVARSILGAAELNVTQAQQALDMTQANYSHGAATTLDVIDAQAALTLAESTRIQALFDHANARATLLYVMARDPLGEEPAAAGGAPDPASAPASGNER